MGKPILQNVYNDPSLRIDICVDKGDILIGSSDEIRTRVNKERHKLVRKAGAYDREDYLPRMEPYMRMLEFMLNDFGARDGSRLSSFFVVNMYGSSNINYGRAVYKICPPTESPIPSTEECYNKALGATDKIYRYLIFSDKDLENMKIYGDDKDVAVHNRPIMAREEYENMDKWFGGMKTLMANNTRRELCELTSNIGLRTQKTDIAGDERRQWIERLGDLQRLAIALERQFKFIQNN